MIPKVNSRSECKFPGCKTVISMSSPKQTRYCNFHKSWAVRDAEIKGQYLKEKGFIDDYYFDSKGFLVVKNYLSSNQEVRGKEIEFSHVGEKIENENKGKGDQRGRNNPSDLTREYTAGSLSKEELYSELDKTIPLIKTIHQMLDDRYSIEEIRTKSSAKESITEASIVLIASCLE